MKAQHATAKIDLFSPKGARIFTKGKRYRLIESYEAGDTYMHIEACDDGGCMRVSEWIQFFNIK